MAQHDSTNFGNNYQYADDDNDFVLPANIQGPGHYLNLHDHTNGLGLAAGRIASGLAAARPAFAAGLIYLATDTGVLSISDAAGWHTTLLADVIATISAIWKFDVGQDWKQIATPGSNPGAGYTRVYVKSDGNIYTLSPAGLESLVGPLPTGVCAPFFGTVLPTYALWADGHSDVIATYARLSAMIRPTLGGADGSHFYVPDYRDRYPMGADNFGQGAASRASGNVALGNTSGADTSSALISHAHSHLHTDSGHTHGEIGETVAGGALSTVAGTGSASAKGSIETSASGVAALSTDATTAGSGSSYSIRPLNQICNWVIGI